MPNQVIPIEGIDKLGFIADTPAVNLPPGAWSDVNNVRFNDGAIRKFLGHIGVFDGTGFMNIQHIAYWENPNRRYYIVVNRDTADSMDRVYTLQLEEDGNPMVHLRYEFPVPTGNERDFWESIQFNGGFSIVINNGRGTPQHITAQTGDELPDDTQFADLPGWASYRVNTPTTDDPDATTMVNSVTANIIIAEGNVLLAGGLVERDDMGAVVRNLGSVVRVSDVAPPGTIPLNWNPFATTGTADEIVIADTGVITAMRPLRGAIYVYTTDTITQLRITPQGLRESIITSEYGALSQTSTFEFRGQHIVIGSDDIYTFSGNPGDIQSISDGRVRRFFYGNLHASFTQDVQIIRDQAFDELWICYANLDSSDGSYNEALIWNYQDNVWTKRDLPNIQSLTTGPIPGGGSARTIINVPDGDTGPLGVSTPATATFTVNAPVPLTFTAGAQDVQAFEGSATGPVSTIGEVTGDSVFLTLPNNFQPGTNAEWNFDPDTGDTFYTDSLDNQAFTMTNTNGSVVDIAHEVATGIHNHTFTLAGGSTAAGVTVVGFDDAVPTDTSYITTTGDTAPVIPITINAGTGPVGAFDSLIYTGDTTTRTIETGIDLANNEGMVWVTAETNNADSDIYDTVRGATQVLRLDGDEGEATQTDGLTAFLDDGWTNAASSQIDGLNQNNTRYHSLSMQSSEDFFDIVEYTGQAGVVPDGHNTFTVFNEGTTTLTVVASGATGDQINAGPAAVCLIGGGGDGQGSGGGQTGRGGQGGSLLWVNFTAVTGDSYTITSQAYRSNEAGGDATLGWHDQGAPAVTVAQAFGGSDGIISGDARRDHNDFIIQTDTSVWPHYLDHGGGVGGFGGDPSNLESSGGGGCGGYAGTAANNYSEGAGGVGAGAAGSDPVDGENAAANSGAAGGGASSGPNGTNGGTTGVYGIGRSGRGGTARNGGAGTGLNGSGGNIFGGSGIGGGGRGGATTQQDGLCHLTAGPNVQYGHTAATTSNVENFRLHREAHNIGSQPGAMIVKAQDSTLGYRVWHKDFNLREVSSNENSWIDIRGNTRITADSAQTFGNTPPDATNFVIGDSAGGNAVTNEPNTTYSTYLFGSNELSTSTITALNGNDPDPNGSIYCGSYSGDNATPQGDINGSRAFFVELGWKPEFMMTKNVNELQPWQMHFLDPEGGNGGTNTLNSRFAENDGGTAWPASLIRFVDVGEPDSMGGTATAAGFTVVSGNNQVNPDIGNSIVFIAIRGATPPDFARGTTLVTTTNEINAHSSNHNSFSNQPTNNRLTNLDLRNNDSFSIFFRNNPTFQSNQRGDGGETIMSTNRIRIDGDTDINQRWFSPTLLAVNRSPQPLRLDSTFNLEELTNGYNTGTPDSGNVNRLADTGHNNVLAQMVVKEGFFDVVRWDGTQPQDLATSAKDTMTHNLNAEVGMIWVGIYANAGNHNGFREWYVYHRGMDETNPSDYWCTLQSPFRQGVGSSQFRNYDPGGGQPMVDVASPWGTITNTTFQIDRALNLDENSMVAFIFAHNPDEGIACTAAQPADTVGQTTISQTFGFRPRMLFSVPLGLSESNRSWRFANDLTGLQQRTALGNGRNNNSARAWLNINPPASTSNFYDVGQNAGDATDTGFERYQIANNTPGERFLFCGIAQPSSGALAKNVIYRANGGSGFPNEALDITTGINMDPTAAGSGITNENDRGGLALIQRVTGGNTAKVLYNSVSGTQNRIATNSAATQETGLGSSGAVELRNGFVRFGKGDDNTNPATTNANFDIQLLKRQRHVLDIVTYSGDSGDDRAIAHGLDSAPAMMWIKDLTSGSGGSWSVYHKDASVSGRNNDGSAGIPSQSGAGAIAELNEVNNFQNATGVNDHFAETDPTAENFFVSSNSGNNDRTNLSGRNYIAFLFGSDGGHDERSGLPLTPTGATDNRNLNGLTAAGTLFRTGTHTVNLGWRPALVIIKQCSGSVPNVNTRLTRDWVYSTPERNAFNGSGINDETLTLNGNQTTYRTIAQPQITDTGFVVGLDDNSASAGAWIYWAVRDVEIDQVQGFEDAISDFQLAGFDGSLTSLPEANLRTFTEATTGTVARDALVAGINATPLPPMNWSATAVGDDQLTLTSDIYGSVGDTGADPHQITTDIVSSGNASIGGATTGTTFGAGSAGNSRFEVNLGTPEDLDTDPVNETFTVCAGTGGHQGDFLATFLNSEETIPGNGSSYMLTGPGVATALNHVTGVGDTIKSVVDTFVSQINMTVAEHDYVASTNDPTNTTTLILTENDRAVSAGDWSMAVRHPVDPDGNTGTLTFNSAVIDTSGDPHTVTAVGTNGPGATPGSVDVYGDASVTVTFPVTPDGINTANVMLTEADGNAFSIVGPAPADTVLNITEEQVATALSAGTYTGFTATSVGNDFTLDQDAAARTTAEFSILGVDTTIDQTAGTGNDIPATLSITITGITPDPSVMGISLNGNETDEEIRQRIITHLNPFGQFTVTESGQDVIVTHNQFGADRAEIDVTYVGSQDILPDGSFIPDPMDTIAMGNEGRGIVETVEDANNDRPWDNGELNEARTFVVSGGAGNIFAYDLGGRFGGEEITSFVERRNFQLEPLADTETLTGFYMHTDSTLPTTAVPLTVKLQGINTAATPVALTTPPDGQTYIFNIGGPDGGDYKIDTRINARMLNYRISETGAIEWEIQAFGVAIDKGGTR